ncbi:hypothetical protein, partial [Corynebacterium striatum]|uniref:hypothetical protein n=1 Tax=Corynebacterium striatum TaxID=43770 RepID=UPI001C0F2067
GHILLLLCSLARIITLHNILKARQIRTLTAISGQFFRAIWRCFASTAGLTRPALGQEKETCTVANEGSRSSNRDAQIVS